MYVFHINSIIALMEKEHILIKTAQPLESDFNFGI